MEEGYFYIIDTKCSYNNRIFYKLGTSIKPYSRKFSMQTNFPVFIEIIKIFKITSEEIKKDITKLYEVDSILWVKYLKNNYSKYNEIHANNVGSGKELFYKEDNDGNSVDYVEYFRDFCIKNEITILEEFEDFNKRKKTHENIEVSNSEDSIDYIKIKYSHKPRNLPNYDLIHDINHEEAAVLIEKINNGLLCYNDVNSLNKYYFKKFLVKSAPYEKLWEFYKTYIGQIAFWNIVEYKGYNINDSVCISLLSRYIQYKNIFNEFINIFKISELNRQNIITQEMIDDNIELVYELENKTEKTFNNFRTSRRNKEEPYESKHVVSYIKKYLEFWNIEYTHENKRIHRKKIRYWYNTITVKPFCFIEFII